MEFYERRLDILRQRKLIWRRGPTTDKPTETHTWGWYYKNGTYQNYVLFKQKNKITTMNMFIWHLRVLWYLNPGLDIDQFTSLCRLLADKVNGFVMHSFKETAIAYAVDNVYNSDLDKPPQNSSRKIIFKEYHGLTKKQQARISGKYAKLGTGIGPEDIYEEMLKLNEDKIRITINILASNLKCTKRTIHRNLDDTLRVEKTELNNKLKNEEL